MFKLTSHWLLIVGSLSILLLASACFQSVGDVPPGDTVSQRLTETWTPVPTEPPTPTEEGTEEAEAIDQPISEFDTPTATLTFVGTPIAQSGEGGTGDNQPDAFQLTATELIRTATQGVADQLTLTAIAQGIGFTPTPIATFTLDPIFLSLTPPVGIPTQPFPSGADCVHEVRAGETMFRYSQTYGLPVATIANANAIVNPNLIIVGQRVIIPGCGTTGARPPATTVPLATDFFGTGGVLTPNPGAGGGAIGACGGQYVIQQYDTLFQISLTCGVPVQSIANVNGITNINYIRMGDILTIPAQ